MYVIERKTSKGWTPIETLPPMASEADAYRLAIERYGREFWAIAVGGPDTLRVVKTHVTEA